MVVASFSHATDIKDQVIGRRLSPSASDDANYIKKRRGVLTLRTSTK